MPRLYFFLLGLIVPILPQTSPAQTVFSGAGLSAATTARDNFRTGIGGGTTMGSNGSFGGVRREINWDSVPAQQAAPNELPGDFFNVNSPRGVVISSPGMTLQVSGATTDPFGGQPAPANFGNLDPSYTNTFAQFSPQRLFTPRFTNVLTVDFFVAGTTTPAVVKGFGSIFSDVDLANVTSIEYFDTVGRSLGKYFVPQVGGNQTISFLGVTFSAPVVRSVKITAGNDFLAGGKVDNGTSDLVVMDDFVYAEPVAAPAQLLNISSRTRVLTGDQVLIDGLIIPGTRPKGIVVRGIGPSLTSNGVSDALLDPVIEVHDASGATIRTNDNWKTDDANGMSQENFVKLFGLAPSDDRESVLFAFINPGAYTAIIRGKNDTTGVGVLEIYDVSPPSDSALGNISGRALVDTGDKALIGGFITGAGGGAPSRMVMRAIGPSLTAFGVPGALQDPTLEIFNGNGVSVGTNDNWKDTQQTDIQNSGLAPTDIRESAFTGLFAPGGYTAIVRGKNNTTGVGVVEIYQIP